MGNANGKWMGSKFGKRLDYNEWIKWWEKIKTLEQTINNNGVQNDFYNEKTSLIFNEQKQSIYIRQITMRLGGVKITSKLRRQKFVSQYTLGFIF